MRRRSLFLNAALGASVALAAACGSSKTLADQLTPSGTATLTGLTISVATPPVGGSVQATALATFSTGTTSPIVTGFATDTPSVATATNSGTITGVAIGDVTISIDYQGLRASKKVHVLPGYGGLYSGSYVIASCTQTDGFAAINFCAPFTTGLALSIAFSNQQSADLTTLTGQFALGQAIGTGTGTIAATGGLSYTGAIAGGTTRMDLRNFTATAPAAGRITGSFEQVWTDSVTSGQTVVVCTNMDATRTSGSPAAFLAPLSGPAGSPVAAAARLLGGVRPLK